MKDFMKSSVRAIGLLGIWAYRYILRLLPYHVTWIIVLVGVYNLSRRVASLFGWGLAGTAALIALNLAAVALSLYEFEERFLPLLHSRSRAVVRSVRVGQWVVIAAYLVLFAFGAAVWVLPEVGQSP